MQQAKLRIGLILQGGTCWIGGTEYSKNLIKALYSLPQELQACFELVPLSEGMVEEKLFADMPDRFRKELKQGLALTPPSLWRRIGNRLIPGLGRSTFSLVREAHQLGIHFLYPYNRSPEDKVIIGSAAWIPDFQHKYLPEFFSPEELKSREQFFQDRARNSACVVLSSQAAAQDFCRFFPQESHKAQILPFCTVCPNEWYEPVPEVIARKYLLPDRYFIVCNQFWQHKNHRVVFEALHELQSRGIRPSLVCTGNVADRRRPEYGEEIQQMLERLQLQNQVHLVGLIPRLDQIQLIRRALAVVQPSLFEGWSTVVEDARALAKPLALSHLPVHREQDPPGAIFFDPHSPRELAEILAPWWQQLSPGPDLAQEKVARGQNRLLLEAFGRKFLEIARKYSCQ